MLVLTRKKDEAIIINDEIQIVVVGIRGDRVRLGVDSLGTRGIDPEVRQTSTGAKPTSETETLQAQLEHLIHKRFPSAPIEDTRALVEDLCGIPEIAALLTIINLKT